MKIVTGILVGGTTYVPGDEQRLLRGPDAKVVDWPQLEQAGAITFDSDLDRIRCLDPKAAKVLREAERKVASTSKVTGPDGPAADPTGEDGDTDLDAEADGSPPKS